MGAVLSQAKTLWLGLKLLLQLRRDLAAVLARARAPPGLPVPRPTAPYWLADPPFPELVRARVPAALPARADVVVIGTGVTGAAAARSLLSSSSSPKPRVVVLDARTLCSGATGRNGGHIKASPHELFARLREAGGMDPARAAELVRFQLRHLEVLVQLCEAEGWDVAECREVETVDLYLDEQGRDKAFAQVRELAKWVPECEIAMWDADAAREKFGPNDAVVGAISYRAGALWPFRLVSCVWADLLAAYPDSLSLQTETPVEGIAPCGGERGGFVVSTPRGDIECAHVVHATNAFATQLVPGLRGKMTGFRAHMTAQRPGAQFPASGGARSWSIMYGSAFDYVTQRPSTVEEDGTEVPGDLMLGGGFSRSAGEGASSVGIWDDSRTDALPLAHLGGVFGAVFAPAWGGGARVKSAWSGIVGVTGDLLPFVGRLDPRLTGRKPGRCESGGAEEAVRPAEWIAAGFCGDGMVWAWLAGTAVGIMLAGAEDQKRPEQPGIPAGRLADWFPKELEPSLQRVRKTSLEDLADLLF